MKTKEEIKELLAFVQKTSNSEINFDEQAILTEYKNQEYNQSSLAIKILSIVGGFIATLAFLGFLLLSGLYNSEVGLLLTGFIFIGISIVLNRYSDKLIMDTFSVSTYIIGIFLVIFGFGELQVDENIIAIIILVIAISSLLLTQNYILSFVSIIVINICLVSLLVFLNRTYNLIHLYNIILVIAMSYLFLYEAKILKMSTKLSRLYNPLRIGLVVSFLFGLGFLRTRKLHELPVEYVWFYSLVLFALLIYMISKIIKVLKIDNQISKIVIYLCSGLIMVVTAFSPSILGAILLILISFYVNYKLGFILGILSLIYFVSQYYYDLNYTLLTKSILLFVSGILFIVLYLFTSKSISNEKV